MCRVLAVEVLAPGNRANDLVVKSTKYAAAGLDHYWVIDVDARTLETFVRDGRAYRHGMAASNEPVDVDLGIAAVRVDIRELLA